MADLKSQPPQATSQLRNFHSLLFVNMSSCQLRSCHRPRQPPKLIRLHLPPVFPKQVKQFGLQMVPLCPSKATFEKASYYSGPQWSGSGQKKLWRGRQPNGTGEFTNSGYCWCLFLAFAVLHSESLVLLAACLSWHLFWNWVWVVKIATMWELLNVSCP